MLDSKKLLNYVYASIVVCLVVVSLSVISFAMSYANATKSVNYRTFSVSAEGKVVASPDVAQFTYTVLSEGKDVAKLEKQNTDKTRLIVAKLNELGIAADDIKTETYLVEPKYQYYQCKSDGTCPPAAIIGYNVSQTNIVKVRDLAKVGSILSEVADLKVDNVSQLSFVVDDKTEIENEARAEAIRLAKQKARSTAKAAGVRVGKLISVYENVSQFGAMSFDANVTSARSIEKVASDTMESMPVPAAQINPGTQDIIVNVTLTYGIN